MPECLGKYVEVQAQRKVCLSWFGQWQWNCVCKYPRDLHFRGIQPQEADRGDPTRKKNNGGLWE